MKLGGPMFERDTETFRSIFRKEGAHYNIYAIDGAVDVLRDFFPEGQANGMNFCLFSTSGVHGTYTTIEAIEQSLTTYGDSPAFLANDDDWPEDYTSPELTVLMVQPRIVCLRYGVIAVSLADIPFLKTIRASSYAAVSSIGAPSEAETKQ